jgi:hypothetical protein
MKLGLSCKGKNILRIFENKMLRRMYGSKRGSNRVENII